MNQYVIGIDGGGSHTRAALAGTDGRVLGMGQAGPSNYDDVGVDMARDNIRSAVAAAFAQTGVPVHPASAAFLGMAGVVSDADRAAIRQIALDIALADPAHIGIDHDIRIALAGGLAGREGIAIIAGTGSSCYGRRADGDYWMSGGWGYAIDDLGSGWFLGQQAMAAAAQAYDGRGPATVLESRVLDALGIASIPEVMHRLYVVGLSRAETAALAPLVITAAEEGDAVSIALIDRAADELARMAQAVAAKLAFPPDVAVTALGGLALSGPTFAAPLAAALARRLPGCRIIAPILPAVLGAVLLALEELGQGATPDIVSALREAS